MYCFWALTIVVIIALKLVSYGHVNYWQRYRRDARIIKMNTIDDGTKEGKTIEDKVIKIVL